MQHNQTVVKQLKQWVNVLQKVTLIRNQKDFLINCRREDLLPKKIDTIKFNNFLFKSRSVNKKFNGFINYMKGKLLNWMIKDACYDLQFHEKKLQFLEKQLRKLLPDDTLSVFFSINLKKYNVTLNIQKSRLEKKFNSLMEKKKKMNSVHTINNAWLKNLTDVSIPYSVYFLLSLGEKFNVSYANDKIPVIQIVKDFEANIYKIPEDKRNEARLELCDTVLRYIKKKKHINAFERKINEYVRECKRFFRNHKDLIFTQADKGNVTVVMYKNDYIVKVQNLLSDLNTYSPVQKNPIETMKKNLNGLLSRWRDYGIIDFSTYKNLYCSDGNLPRAYGLPKIHKENNPLRIIVSSVGSPTYKFARYLQDVITKHIKTANSFVKHSLDVKEKLGGITIPYNYKLISLDVCSLFTNVPRDLVFKAIDKRWCDIQTFINFDNLQVDLNIVKNEFSSAIEFVMNSTTFKFDGKIYNQKFGTAMGSPISPVLADIVMQDLETDCLKKLDFEVPFFFRYVDDIITAVPENKIEFVLSIFNSYHKKLQFTHEIETNNEINFLDLKLIRSGNKLIFNWYRKPTFSGRYINYLSCHPFNQKISMVYHLVDKAIGLSEKTFHSQNLNLIRQILLQNNYPQWVVNKYIKKRQYFISTNNNSHVSRTRSDNKNYMVFPYIPVLEKPINNLLKKYNVKAAYKTENKVNKWFIKKEKDRLSTDEKCNVIYQINCNNCDANYIGQTVRQLKKRIYEHKNNVKRNVNYHNVVSKHCTNFNHKFNFDNVKILDVENDWKKRNLSEMIHIKINKNTINLQSDTNDLNKIYDKLFTSIKVH